MAASDATPFPIKNQAYRITFPILDADGDLVTGATGLDSEVSKDAGTFADCTNEATEIATNSGVYYLDLTSTEMNADTVAIIVKTSSSGAKTTTLILTPITDGLDIPVNTTHAAGTAWGSGAITAASIAADAITAAKIATGAIDADAIAADAITAAKIADGAIDAATFAAGAITATVIADGAIDAATFAASAITSTVLANDCITDAKISGTAVAEIQSGLATASSLSGVETKVDIVDTVVDAIQAKTDNLPASPASTTNITAGTITTVTNLTNAPTAGDLTATMKASVNAEVVDCLNVDTYAEPAGAPAATSTLRAKIGWIFKLFRNKRTQDSTTETLYADDGTTADATSTKSDDGTTATRGEWTA